MRTDHLMDHILKRHLYVHIKIISCWVCYNRPKHLKICDKMG